MAEDQCSIIDEASRSAEFNAILVAKTLICLGGAALLLRQWIVHGVRFLGHANSRVLFHFYYAMFFLLGLNIGVLYLFDFVRLRFACYLIDFRLVIMLRGVCITSILSAHLILILMSLERLYSSFYPAKFERSSAQIRTALLAVTVVAASATYVFCNLTAGFTLFHERKVALADPKVRENAARYVETNIALSITNGLSLMIFFLDIYLNFYRKIKQNLTLGASYQFVENRRVILVLMPIEIIDCIFTLLTTVAQILHAMFIKNAAPLGRQIFLESTTFIVGYPLILAIIIEWKVGRRKRAALRDETSIDYFENLQKFWA